MANAEHADTSPASVVHAREMVNLLGEQMGMGFWRFVIASGAVFWSTRVFEIYGLPVQDGPVSLETAMVIIAPEDRSLAAERLKETLVEKVPRKYVFRADTPSGIKVIECTTGAMIGPRGDVVELFGTFLDITAKAAPSATSVGRSLLLRALMKNIPAAVAVFDGDMNYLAVSDFWVSGHNATSGRDLVGKNHYALRPDIIAAHKIEHARVLASETVRSPRDYMRDENGRPIRQTCVMCPWHTIDGQIGGMIMMMGNVDVAAPKGDAATSERPTRGELLDILSKLDVV